MALTAERADGLERLERDLRLVTAPGPDLFSRVMADACTRIPVLRTAGKVGHIDRLVAAGAWRWIAGSTRSAGGGRHRLLREFRVSSPAGPAQGRDFGTMPPL